jgi:hypothetical protein
MSEVGSLHGILRRGPIRLARILPDASTGYSLRGLVPEVGNSGLSDIRRVPHKHQRSSQGLGMIVDQQSMYLTFCATSSRCCLTRLLQAGWYKAKKLHGSRKVTKWDSLGKNSTFSTLNSAICSRAIGVLSIRSRNEGSNTVHQCQLLRLWPACDNISTYMMSKPRTSSGTFSSADRP